MIEKQQQVSKAIKNDFEEFNAEIRRSEKVTALSIFCILIVAFHILISSIGG